MALSVPKYEQLTQIKPTRTNKCEIKSSSQTVFYFFVFGICLFYYFSLYKHVCTYVCILRSKTIDFFSFTTQTFKPARYDRLTCSYTFCFAFNNIRTLTALHLMFRKICTHVHFNKWTVELFVSIQRTFFLHYEVINIWLFQNTKENGRLGLGVV